MRLHDPLGVHPKTYERWRKFITKIHADLVFQVSISRFWAVSGHLALQKGVSWCTLECYPVLSLNGLKLCKFVGNENSARSFSDRNFWKSLRVVDVRAFGSWMSALKCLFFQDFDRPDRSFGPGYPREWPPDVRGMSVPKTSSLGWFSFVNL